MRAQKDIEKLEELKDQWIMKYVEKSTEVSRLEIMMENLKKQEANTKNVEKDNEIEKLEKTNDVLKDKKEMTMDEVTKLKEKNKDLEKQLNELNDK